MIQDLNQYRNTSFSQLGEPRQYTCLHYYMHNLRALKLVALIKFARLKYLLEEHNEQEGPAYVLRTAQGELHYEYEIINYIVFYSRSISQRDSQERGTDKEKEEDSENSITVDGQAAHGECVRSLCCNDGYLLAKINYELFKLRIGLFATLYYFYRYLTGWEKVRKSKYDALSNRLKKEVGRLDALMNEHGEIFGLENSYLNILIVCELLLACKFVFEEKFRKSKHSLFSKCERIYGQHEFQAVFGYRIAFCEKEYLPLYFEDEYYAEPRRNDYLIPAYIIKLSEVFTASNDSSRNELLYNYFRSIFEEQHYSKMSYFPYFWLMYDRLNLTLVELSVPSSMQSLNELSKSVRLITHALRQSICGNLDYGIIGIYQYEKDKHYEIRGMLAMGSKSVYELNRALYSILYLQYLQVHKIDVQNEYYRKKMYWIFEHVTYHSACDGIMPCVIIYV